MGRILLGLILFSQPALGFDFDKAIAEQNKVAEEVKITLGRDRAPASTAQIQKKQSQGYKVTLIPRRRR